MFHSMVVLPLQLELPRPVFMCHLDTLPFMWAKNPTAGDLNSSLAPIHARSGVNQDYGIPSPLSANRPIRILKKKKKKHERSKLWISRSETKTQFEARTLSTCCQRNPFSIGAKTALPTWHAQVSHYLASIFRSLHASTCRRGRNKNCKFSEFSYAPQTLRIFYFVW